MPLFEVAIIDKAEGVERLAFGPKAVVAKDRDAALVIAMQPGWNEGTPLDLDTMSVLVRPFTKAS